jgi:hypothetical protein
MDITSTVQMCIFASGIISGVKCLKNLYISSASSDNEITESDFVQALICSLLKHNMELSKLLGIVTFLYKHMHELCLQNKLT